MAANLGRPIRLSEVARAASFSEYHFHRIFRSVMGETVGQYITRQRLETAALMLAYHDDLSVTDIGFACGYSSTANFSKAFSAFFGVSPSAVRKPQTCKSPRIGTLKLRYGKDFSPSDLYSLPEPPQAGARLADLDESMRFENQPAFPVVCMSGDKGYDLETNTRLWVDLIRRATHLGLCGEDVDSYGIPYDDPALTASGYCRYDACIRVSESQPQLPAPLFASEIPAGRFAVFPYRGHASHVSDAYRDIYSVWFPNSSLAPEGFPPVEHYINDEPEDDGTIDMEILIKVRPMR